MNLEGVGMRLVTGALLIVAAEQAFAHAHLVQFPHHDIAAEILLPGSFILLLLGGAFLLWGLVGEYGQARRRLTDHNNNSSCVPTTHTDQASDSSP